MSKSVELKPGDDNPRSYPWGNNTATYKVWLVLLTVNIIAIGVLFVVDVEIPFIQEATNPNAALEKGSSGSLAVGNETRGTASTGGGLTTGPQVAVSENAVVDWLDRYGMWVIIGNVVLVTVFKTVGKWLTVVETWCRNLCTCKWYKPWCCIGQLFCWLVTVLKWVTWVIAVVSSVITTVLVWVTQNADKVQG